MPPLIDLTGQRYGKLVCLYRVENDNYGRSKWRCQCDCGKVIDTSSNYLRTGSVSSCGCLRHHINGSAYDKLYKRWIHMKQRCYDPNLKMYKYYGGRGIKVCDEWRNNYEAFREWAYENGYDDSLPARECSLDRIDSNGDYEPGNCRWTDIYTQNNNKSDNRLITLNGETKTLAQWVRATGINRSTLENRIIRWGYDAEKLLSPVKKHRKSAS